MLPITAYPVFELLPTLWVLKTFVDRAVDEWHHHVQGGRAGGAHDRPHACVGGVVRLVAAHGGAGRDSRAQMRVAAAIFHGPGLRPGAELTPLGFLWRTGILLGSGLAPQGVKISPLFMHACDILCIHVKRARGLLVGQCAPMPVCQCAPVCERVARERLP